MNERTITEFQKGLVYSMQRYRKHNKLSKKEFARILELKEDEWNSIERNSESLSVATLLLFCEISGIAPSDLFDLVENNLNLNVAADSVLLKLYVSVHNKQKTVSIIENAMKGLDSERFKLFVFDASAIPQVAKLDNVKTTPTLVRERFLPEFQSIHLGSLNDPNLIRRFILGLHPVEGEVQEEPAGNDG